MSLSVPNTGATAVEASRYAVIPGQIGDIVELPADRRQRGRDNGLVESGQEHRQHQAHQDRADFAWRQRRSWQVRRRVTDVDDLSRCRRQIACGRSRQYLLAGRAVPFEFVHAECAYRVANGTRLRINYGLQFRETIRATAAGYAHGCIPRMTIA